ncbi:acetylxylan esterase [Spirosoma sp. KCTC 42546]|uniref:alpha/beta hydrolase family protein n=1 Tax=Spirosoma sp. KCTC 42546 TaxID=2520506 RepID=UPI0011586FC3|nr:acetylxylan esterase [Spirosoma sp. KCTC 42546]QDK82792.1 acetylxylan esterase [Spirosoma sp. KCTC 42546]
MKNNTYLFPFCRFIGWVCVLVGLHSRNTNAQAPNFQKMSPEERTAYMNNVRVASQADWQTMMDKLNLKLPALPPPADDPKRPSHVKPKEGSTNWYDEAGNTHVRSGWGNWTNYEESKANDYTLPDPLKLKNGKPVKDANTWWKQRRPEILNEYLTEIYGKTPTNTPKVTFAPSGIDSTVLSGKALRKNMLGSIDNSRYPSVTPSIPVTYYRPVNASGKIPMMVIVWGSFPQPMANIEKLIDAGWAVATVNTGAIQADNGAGLHEGIIGLMNGGKDRTPDEWGVLAAWSWGLSRVLDHFEKDNTINAKQIGVQGHSRWGKTALLTGALDPRWAIVFASCSGSLGASLEKRSWGETIDNVAGPGEYHWMAGNFLKYGGNWAAMPVDAHELMALIAPRPLFITGGTKDSWADPKGEFMACVGASPVYELLGKKGVGTTEMPAPDVSLIHGELAFRNHEGGHVDSLDWPVFLEFANRQFKLKK